MPFIRSGNSPDRDGQTAAAGVRETYQYLVGDSAFHFTVDDGSIELYDGRADDPAIVLTTDEETLGEIVSGKLTASSAVASGALTLAVTGRLRSLLARSSAITRYSPRLGRSPAADGSSGEAVPLPER
jgi:putative sterol carrier protein